MPKRATESRREIGIRTAVALLHRLNRNSDLALSCDPGWDEKTEARPRRNIVFEQLEAQIAAGDRAWIEGFCLGLSGYLAIDAGGCTPSPNICG